MHPLRDLAPCRRCLGPLGAAAEAGLCARCWELLAPLPEERCPRCALPHGAGEACPDPVAWSRGDAFWDYHGMGSFLVPGVKRGELGWKAALLRRARKVGLPEWAWGLDVVASVPTAGSRRLVRGFDLAEEAAAMFAGRLKVAFQRLLRKPFFARAQAGLPRSLRRRMEGAVRLVRGADVEGLGVLLVDDVWTTGTSLLRCARVLGSAGARDVAVLALFRAGRRGGN